MADDFVRIRNAFGSELNETLTRWGRTMRPTARAATSPTYEICSRLAVLAGVVQPGASSGVSDEERKDGELTEKAWSFMRVPIPAKRALALLYVGGVPVHVISRKMKMPIGVCVDSIISAGLTLNRTRMNIIENGVPIDNRRYNSLTG